MKNNLSNYFPHIYSISPKTTDFRVRDFYFNKQSVALDIIYKNWTGFISSVFEKFVNFKYPNKSNLTEPFGYKLVTLAHISLIEYAYDQNFPNLLVFENDVIFYKDFNKIIDSVLAKLPNDWDIFYLGATYSDNNSTLEKFSDYLYKITGRFLTAHSYAINRKAMKRILDHYYSILEIEHSIYCIDQFLGTLSISGGFNVYGVLPKLTEQGYFGEKSLSCPAVFDTFKGDIHDFKEDLIVVREPFFEHHKMLDYIKKEDYLYYVK